ncbi:MAG: hypothetical protein CBC09_02280 [Cellvibrionales bacterium TMED49]|nr:MAG: hypothetical protein CBC09_02280 [Cellvibrionales bacterium TMED49]
MRSIYLLPLLLLAIAPLGSFFYFRNVPSASVAGLQGISAPLMTPKNLSLSPVETQLQNFEETKVIRKRSDFTSLSVGSTFTISGISGSQVRRLVGLVEFVERKESFSQFYVSIKESGKGVVTVTDDSVDIFLKTVEGVYEFSNDDFDGIVTEVKSVTWGNDIDYPSERPGEYPASIKTFEVVE